ncbi:hypothetical protein POZ03_01085 [Bacteroides uniformis]|uniref:hypothetical protein n=1 Tax=Bacteroides uniformis TaxID=820 RepID=UPI00233F07C1|nr:hypothetical protein [Bacteroides uniformis]MDC1809051.1 hypothetical protein [Bacteroides uniformis]
MKHRSIEVFGVKVVNCYTDNIIDMILSYIESDPRLKEEYSQLIQDYGDEVVKERLTNLIATHFGVRNKKEEI